MKNYEAEIAMSDKHQKIDFFAPNFYLFRIDFSYSHIHILHVMSFQTICCTTDIVVKHEVLQTILFSAGLQYRNQRTGDKEGSHISPITRIWDLKFFCGVHL